MRNKQHEECNWSAHEVARHRQPAAKLSLTSLEPFQMLKKHCFRAKKTHWSCAGVGGGRLSRGEEEEEEEWKKKKNLMEGKAL